MQNNFVLGVDIGGTNFRIGLVNEKGELSNYIKESSSILNEPGNPLINLKEYLLKYIKENLSGELKAISIGFPSTISKDKKKVYSTPNLPGFNDINIVDYLCSEIKVPIFLSKDVNCLLKWDMVDKNISKEGITLGFYIGTGFGNSICIDGKFLIGKNGSAGELGHIPVLNSDDKCGCGNIGCIELYASGKRLSKIREESFKNTEIDELFVKHRHSEILEEFINTISIPIATEINIFDPDNIIIGGGVVNMNGFPKDFLEECIYKHSRKPFPAESLKFLYSSQTQEAGVLGAAFKAMEKLNRK
ncbi:allose kinase [Clostridium tetanomorphum]|uniref:Allose kinase n=1 Tax=Clostridium tetanomorphum TaxID=1553 RepID=A0A923EDY8_CLOTT|nr:allose kinase [Clostridium tetanomorphum]KAJ50529.1 D-allose kinase [Clostridium tetanomorphum DSM 665]MBC2399871.1 allose kinase [Clostridium tetanomorphum]MBP1866344.1 allose kinase [Clostridium tetanomorphum]NRS83238.1 allose kinase [Clostridium tetanomorphum]NRZ98662.1 allose kinase [Clostridium tetanomorphum]